MIVNEEFLKKLRSAFDLNIYEVKVWTALLSRGVAAAGELADISNVPRSRSYDVLENLEKKGFIIMKLGKPIKYIAVKPEEILKRIKKKVQDDADVHLKTLDKVNETDTYREIELLYKQGIDKVEPSELSGVVKGRKNVYDHLKTIIANAEKSVCIMTTEKGLLRKVEVLKSVMKKAKSNGVKIKVVAPIKDISFLSKEVRDAVELRASDENTKARFVLVDGKELLFMLADDQDVHEAYDMGIWVKTPYFAQALNSMFELNWKNLKRI
ncbi:TrmB family transcriptional regulator [Candidatus Woesearchaeota archaeon]|nr:TrmB family transcriptional regulator [Candidatus Woesearchaeota archaeon]